MKKLDLQKKEGFLLIEQLMALAIFAVSIILISGVYQVLIKVQNKMEVPNYIEWHLMVTQMDTHLQGYARSKYQFGTEFDDVRPTNNAQYKIEAVSEHEGLKSVVKISKNGGYHPVLVGYEEIIINKIKDGVSLKAVLRNQEEFEIDFIPGNRVITCEKEVTLKDETNLLKIENEKEEIQ